MAIRIYIDQGHNPRNPNAGAEANGYREQDITYRVGKYLAEYLDNDADFTARVSRPTPETQLGTSNASSLSARVRDANTWGADYFISIHTNTAESPRAAGSEAFVYRTSSRAYPLAENILRWLRYVSGFPTRGVFERPGLYVLRYTRMPATLVELGFLSNPEEARFMADNTRLLALGIYRGIQQYFGLL